MGIGQSAKRPFKEMRVSRAPLPHGIAGVLFTVDGAPALLLSDRVRAPEIMWTTRELRDARKPAGTRTRRGGVTRQLALPRQRRKGTRA